MNNLPDRTTQDMVDAQCAPVPSNMDCCYDCGDEFPIPGMYPWQKFDPFQRRVCDVYYLCEHCVPKCQWRINHHGIITLTATPCGRIQSPNAQGPWCAEHEAEANALDESEGSNGI